MHEHLLSDLSPLIEMDVPASRRWLLDEPVRLDNYDAIRRHGDNRGNMRLTSELDATEEMHTYRASGGSAIVESTSIGIGRDPTGLARISRATGVQIIMGAGYYVADVHPSLLIHTPVEEIAEMIQAEAVDGVTDECIRPGIIGEIGLSWPVHPTEEKVLRAASQAQVATGLPLQIHPGRNERAPLDALRIVRDAGGIAARSVMSHVDRTLFSLDDMKKVAESGCYLEFDLFGQESSFYKHGPIDMPNDATRIDYIMALIDNGFGRQIVVSQDICHKVHMEKYGGEGYSHILRNVIPLMLRKGMTRDDVRLVCVDNPREVLTRR